jgi:hypothetical protein
VFGQQQPEQMQFEKEARKRMNQKEYARIKPEPAHLTPGNSIYEKKQEEAATIKRIHARLADAADASRKQQAQMLDDAFAEYGFDHREFQEQLSIYIHFLADNNGQTVPIRPTREIGKGLKRGRVVAVQYEMDTEDHAQNLWLSLVHPTNRDAVKDEHGNVREKALHEGQGIRSYHGNDGKPISHWVNVVFERQFGRKFTEWNENNNKLKRIDERDTDSATSQADAEAGVGDRSSNAVHIDHLSDDYYFDYGNNTYEKWMQRLELDWMRHRMQVWGKATYWFQHEYAPKRTVRGPKHEIEQYKAFKKIRAKFMYGRQSAIADLVMHTDMTAAEIAKEVGRHPSTISHLLRAFHDDCEEAGIDSRALGGIFVRYHKNDHRAYVLNEKAKERNAVARKKRAEAKAASANA